MKIFFGFTSTLLIAASVLQGALAAPQAGEDCRRNCDAALSGCLNNALPSNPNLCSTRFNQCISRCK